jgi:hypothetical protein
LLISPLRNREKGDLFYLYPRPQALEQAWSLLIMDNGAVAKFFQDGNIVVLFSGGQ